MKSGYFSIILLNSGFTWDMDSKSIYLCVDMAYSIDGYKFEN